MLEDLRSEDFSFRFRKMNSTGYKIFLTLSWLIEDEVFGYYLRDFLKRTLTKKNMTIEKGRFEFFPYLISRNSATKAFSEEFLGRESEIFGLLRERNSQNEFTFPIIFVSVKPKLKSKVRKYSGYCRGYKSSSPAEKDSGYRLREEIKHSWNRKKLLYQLLFDLKPRIDEALFTAGFTDNYEQITELLEFKIKIEYELKTL